MRGIRRGTVLLIHLGMLCYVTRVGTAIAISAMGNASFNERPAAGDEPVSDTAGAMSRHDDLFSSDEQNVIAIVTVPVAWGRVKVE